MSLGESEQHISCNLHNRIAVRINLDFKSIYGKKKKFHSSQVKNRSYQIADQLQCAHGLLQPEFFDGMLSINIYERIRNPPL